MESIIPRLINFDALCQLEEEIAQIDDTQEREAREALLAQIMDKLMNYDAHVKAYLYKTDVQRLIAGGLGAEPTEKARLVLLWDSAVDRRVSAQQKRATPYYNDQYRWHLFSFGLLPALQQQAAKEAFDRAEKRELYVFFEDGAAAYRLQNAQLLTAAEIETLHENCPPEALDAYFWEAQDGWVYVRPHEADCGPYFFRWKDAERNDSE